MTKGSLWDWWWSRASFLKKDIGWTNSITYTKHTSSAGGCLVSHAVYFQICPDNAPTGPLKIVWISFGGYSFYGTWTFSGFLPVLPALASCMSSRSSWGTPIVWGTSPIASGSLQPDVSWSWSLWKSSIYFDHTCGLANPVEALEQAQALNTR